jgi:hypothetical protein
MNVGTLCLVTFLFEVCSLYFIFNGAVNLNVHWVIDVRQTEIHTAEPLVSEPSAWEFEMVIEYRKRHKSPGIDQIPAEFITAGGRKIHLYP